jgi:hypothetical protein
MVVNRCIRYISKLSPLAKMYVKHARGDGWLSSIASSSILGSQKALDSNLMMFRRYYKSEALFNYSIDYEAFKMN